MGMIPAMLAYRYCQPDEQWSDEMLNTYDQVQETMCTKGSQDLVCRSGRRGWLELMAAYERFHSPNVWDGLSCRDIVLYRGGK